MTTKSNAAVLPSTFGQRLKNDMRRNWVVYLMLLPVIAFFFIFNYLPMAGLLMAFENFKIKLGFSKVRGWALIISSVSLTASISAVFCATR